MGLLYLIAASGYQEKMVALRKSSRVQEHCLLWHQKLEHKVIEIGFSFRFGNGSKVWLAL